MLVALYLKKWGFFTIIKFSFWIHYFHFRLVNDLLTLVINDRAKLGLIAFNPRWIVLAFVLNLRSIIAWLILDTRRPTSIQSAHKRGGREQSCHAHFYSISAASCRCQPHRGWGLAATLTFSREWWGHCIWPIFSCWSRGSSTKGKPPNQCGTFLGLSSIKTSRNWCKRHSYQ